MTDNQIVKKGIDRLVYQFEKSVKFQEFIASFLNEFQELYNSENQLLKYRYIDTAEGVQLDGIGEIVGLPRPKIETILEAFGFLEDPTALGFGDFFNPDVGGYFWDGISGSYILASDKIYRILIKAKILENQTPMNVDDTIQIISNILMDTEVEYYLQSNLHPRYYIARYLDNFEIELVCRLPMLIGLGDVCFILWTPDTTFSFLEDPEGLGFGDIDNPDVGGTWASIIGK